MRVEAVGFIDHYCAVYRTAGEPDRFLDGQDGKPLRFASATAAIRAGRKALSAAKPPAGDDPDQNRFRAWRADKDLAIAEERLRVFGDDDRVLTRNGREIVVERRRR